MRRPYHYIIDLDGTIYKNKVALPYAETFIRYLEKEGRSYVFYTNCPENTPALLQDVLAHIGISVPVSRIMTSGTVAADYLREQGYRTAYVIGSEAYRTLVEEVGVTVLKGTERTADCVLVGFDREFGYGQLLDACRHVERGAKLLATNTDEAIPVADGVIPHTGAILAAVERATKRQALVLGKPSSYSCRALQKYLGCAVDEMCMVGDRLDTDMQFARQNGFDALLMLTGMTEAASLEEKQRGLYLEKFRDLGELIDYDRRTAGGCRAETVEESL